MENPFEQGVPADVLQRVHAFARDLAYGVTLGLWHSQIHWQKLLNPEISHHSRIFAQYLRPKWGGDFPSEYLMLSFGYFQEHGSEGGHSRYLLTEKAFRLLERPAGPPSVFISYRRSESSTFGLLIEARLKLVGNPNPFIDKNLVPGEEWNAQLRQKIEACRYFVCLIGRTTLESPHVMQELEWAAAGDRTIISIWHNGQRMSDATLPQLRDRHAIVVTEETALGYELAVNQLLNSLGYSTY